jgi:hypothetical protein
MKKILVEFKNEQQVTALLEIIDFAVKGTGLAGAAKCLELANLIQSSLEKSKISNPQEPAK